MRLIINYQLLMINDKCPVNFMYKVYRTVLIINNS